MTSTHVVYVDALFLINFVVDGIILWSVGRFTGVRARRWRIVLAASLGGLYSLLVIWPALAWTYGIVGKLLVSLLMLLAVWAPIRRYDYVRVLVWFYFLSFATAGTAYGLISLTETDGSNGMPVGWSMTITLSILIVATLLGSQYLAKKRNRDLGLLDIGIELDGRTIWLKGLVDTANHLRDPLTQMPVVVVELHAVSSLLPDALREFAVSGHVELQVWDQQMIEPRLRLIPYKALGTARGMLIGIKPDALLLKHGDTTKEIYATVAFSPRKLSNGEFLAIVPADLVSNFMVMEGDVS